MAEDGKRMMNGIEVYTLPRGSLVRKRLVGMVVLAVLVALLLVVASTAWAQPAGANFVADVQVEVYEQVETMRVLALSEHGSATFRSSRWLDVPAVQQLPELPAGCESVALVNLLRFYGFDVGKTEIADDWLATSDSDFVNAFLGDPYSVDGGTCMAPGLANAADAYLSAHGSGLRAVDATGSSFSQVLAAVDAGAPVIVWCTVDMEEPGDAYASAYVDGFEYRFLQPSHCVVVSGYDLDAGFVYASDSLAGQVAYPLNVFAERYYQLGAQALMLA